MNPEPYVNPPINTFIMVTNFFAIAFGFIFKDMLEYKVERWNANRQTQPKIDYQTPNLIIAYLGLNLFVILLMGAGFSVFGLPNLGAYGLASIVVLPTAILIWLQLGSMLKLLVKGGSEAINIDSYGAGEIFDPQTRKSQSKQ